MRTGWRFLRTNIAWLLAVPPLLIVGIAVHVSAWCAALLATGGTFGPWRVLPHAYPDETVYFGEVLMFGGNHTIVALAPMTTWLVIAAASTLFFAAKGRSRSLFLDRVLFVSTIVLPIIAVSLELLHIYTRRGPDGETLYADRLPLAACAIPTCSALIAMARPRVRALFDPPLALPTYAFGWLVILFLSVAIRHTNLLSRAILASHPAPVAANLPTWTPPPDAPPITSIPSSYPRSLCDDCEDWDDPGAHTRANLRALTMRGIREGMSKVRPVVAKCYEQFRSAGLANVAATIGVDGHIREAQVSGSFAGTPTGTCIERAVLSATFPKPSAPHVFTFPFILR